MSTPDMTKANKEEKQKQHRALYYMIVSALYCTYTLLVVNQTHSVNAFNIFTLHFYFETATHIHNLDTNAGINLVKMRGSGEVRTRDLLRVKQT